MMTRATTLCVLMILTTAAAAQSPTWHKVLEVKGSASKQTDKFEITAKKWRIAWTLEATKEHIPGITIAIRTDDDILQLASGEQSDSTYIHQSGVFYLSIASGRPYSIIVEEWR